MSFVKLTKNRFYPCPISVCANCEALGIDVKSPEDPIYIDLESVEIVEKNRHGITTITMKSGRVIEVEQSLKYIEGKTLGQKW